jgi:hypothetical protein
LLLDPRRRICVVASLFALALFLALARGATSGEEAVHLGTVEAVWQRGSPALEGGFVQRPWTSRAADGRVYSALDPGLPVLLAPWVGLGALVAREPPRPLDQVFHLTEPSPAPAPLVEALRETNEDPRVLAAALVGPLAGALVLFFLLLALEEAGCGERALKGSAVLLGATWPLVVYAGTLWSQVPALALLCGAAWACVRLERRGGWRAALVAGVLTGAAALVRLEGWWLSSVVLVAAGLGGARHGRAVGALLAAVVGLVPAGLVEWVWLASTHAVALGARRSAFGALPVWEGLSLVVASPAVGLLPFAPAVWLAPGSWKGLTLRSRALAVFAVGVPLVQLAATCTWFDWAAAMSSGPRYLIASAVFASLPAAASLESATALRRRVISGAAALGLLIALPAALQYPRVHDLTAQNAWHRWAPWEAWRALLSGTPVVTAHFQLSPSIDCLSLRHPVFALGAVACAAAAVWVWRRKAT